jgi:hypothetical protein
MPSISESLVTLSSTKAAIKSAIESKGQNVSAVPFAGYAAKIAAIDTNLTPKVNAPDAWVRPADWLSMPTVVNTDSKFVGLHAVYADGNFVSLSATGNYTVDWGDGTVQNFASGVQADHEYSYANAGLNGTLSTRGYKQALIVVTPQSGQSLTSINLNLRHPGSPGSQYVSNFLDIVLSGPNLTSVVFGAQYNYVTLSILERVSVLKVGSVSDWSSMFNNCNSLQSVAGLDTTGATTMTNMFSLCQMLTTVPLFDTSTVSNFSGMFQACTALLTVPLFNTASGVDFNSMFTGCTVLQSVPLFNMAAATNVSTMFNLCRSLQTVPLFNWSAVTNGNTTFNGCVSLVSVPNFNMSANPNFISMFAGCSSLNTAPLINTAAATATASMFSGCSVLNSVPLLNTALVTSFNSMFANCTALRTVPLFNTSSGTSFTSMFSACKSLKSVPLFDLSHGTSFTSMFLDCYSLTDVPAFNFAAGGNMTNMFSSCHSMQKVPLFVFPASSNLSGMFGNCRSVAEMPAMELYNATNLSNFMYGSLGMSKVSITGPRFAFAVDNFKLSKAALETLFMNLGTGTGTTALSVTGNYGADTPFSKTTTATSGSAVLTATDTSGLTVGMQATGTGVSTGLAVTYAMNTDLFMRTAHGIPDGTPVSFTTPVSGSLPAYKNAYVVNATADTFKVSLTPGGAAVDLGSDGSATMLFLNTITAIVPNTSITLAVPASASGAASRNFRNLRTAYGTLKGWNITG